MKQVYILLSRTGTVPSKIIHLFTRKKYTHASISLVPATNDFYSYGRRRPRNFLVAGLVREDLHGGVFKAFPKTTGELFSLEVSDESYEKIKELIELYMDNYDRCTYKFSAFITMPLHIKKKLGFKLACSQFVAKLLYESGACELPKHPSLMHPIDFMSIDKIKSIYVGKVKDCRFPEASEE